MSETVVMAMSGGVDSSVAAYLLKEQGYNVIGVIMQIWQDEEKCDIERAGGCCGYSAVNDARMVADKLDIPFYVLNFKSIFKEKVIDYFVEEYFKARTPNPCIACNRFVKWESLLNKAVAMGADFIATGHYGGVLRLPNGRFTIKMDFTNPKDQSYALYNLSQYQLERTLMPLAHLRKDRVREIAAELGLKIANKPDSQEICFITGDYGDFVKASGKGTAPEGNFIDEKGNILGKHRGIVHYTIGQRKGLGIAFGKPMFVKKINPENNTVILCENDGVFTSGLIARDINYMALEDFEKTDALVKIRYAHKPTPCTIEKKGDSIICMFESPQRAVTPGQSAVFYDGEGHIICGGTIEGSL